MALDAAEPTRQIEGVTTHRAIIEGLAKAADAGDSTVLATVVRVTGSSYGGVGARMLVRVDGSTVGLVSGGCLESDLAEHAKRISSNGRAEVVSYDTRNDEDAPWGLGLGCNGLIEILIVPVSPSEARDIAGMLGTALGGSSPAVIATVMRVSDAGAGAPAVGAHALLLDELRYSGSRNWGRDSNLAEAAKKFPEALAAGRRGMVAEIGSAEIAFEVVMPSIRLVVCGSGPDARPIAAMGVDQGWDVIVADHRPLTDAHVARFPGAKVIHCADASKLSDIVSPTRRTAVVVASHHFERDRNYLQSLLASNAGYIGMLGPRARTERMLSDLAGRGIGGAEGDERLYAPVGMDIGGDGPDAIALSIVAEVSAVLGERSGGHHRDRRGPLHTTTQPTQGAGAT